VPAPADFASLYVLLASRDEGRAITGSVLEADSGLSVRGIGRPAGGWGAIAATGVEATA
jgi:hypothetical protein